MSGYTSSSSVPQAARSPNTRLTALKRKLAEIEALVAEQGAEQDQVVTEDTKSPVVIGSSERAVVRFANDRGDILVTVGTSKDAQKDPEILDRISDIVEKAYSGAGKRKRVDREDAMDRLEMGDDGVRANRVLHLAWLGDTLAGCASSTFSPGWTPEGCGHWGLLAVDPAFQGRGVATALIMAAEWRLATVSEAIQIEYQHIEGEAFSERLFQWYEGALGFDGGPRPKRPGMSSFRRCFKLIPEADQERGRRRRLQEIRKWLREEVAEEEEQAQQTA